MKVIFKVQLGPIKQHEAQLLVQWLSLPLSQEEHRLISMEIYIVQET